MEVPDTFPGLFAAYTVIWLLLTLYIVSLGRRMQKVERRLSESKPEKPA